MTVFDFKSSVPIGHNAFISEKKGMADAQWANDLLTTHKNFPECSEDPNQDCYFCLRARRDHQKETQYQPLSQRSPANSQHYLFRNWTITNRYRFTIAKPNEAIF